MAARESAAVLEALAAVQAGTMTRAAAAERYGVAPSSITRALARRKLPHLRPGRRAQPVPPLPEPYHFGDGTPLVLAPSRVTPR